MHQKQVTSSMAMLPIADGVVHAFVQELPGYWMDVGQPKDYLTGACWHAPLQTALFRSNWPCMRVMIRR